MAFGSTPRDAQQIPVGSVYVPGVGFVAWQGGTQSTDGSSNTSAPGVIQLGDGTGLIASSVIGGIRYLRNAIVQDVELSAVNSSTANLGSGASFTGTSASTLGVAAIQVCVFADQPCTVQVQQSLQDPGTSWDIIDSWTVAASSNAQDATRTVQALGAACRIIVTNNGGSTTTVFRLTTVLCPVVDPMPRTLTQYGNLRCAIAEANQDNITVINANAVTTTQTSADLTNNAGKGAIFVLDMTNVGTGSVTIAIKGKDPVSGKYYTILTGLAVTTNSTNIYRIYPGLTVAANATGSDLLPKTYQVVVTANNANATTYKVGALLIV